MNKATTEKLSYDAVLDYLKTLRKRRGKKRMTKRHAWEKLEQRLDEIKVPPHVKKSIAIWTWENMNCHDPKAIKPRELHEIEAMTISPVAHGKILDAVFEGMITTMQGERLIDDMMELEPPDFEVDLERVEAALVKAWKRNTKYYEETTIN